MVCRYHMQIVCEIMRFTDWRTTDAHVITYLISVFADSQAQLNPRKPLILPLRVHCSWHDESTINYMAHTHTQKKKLSLPFPNLLLEVMV